LPIQLLSPQLANQIAAGEVVERPASVVKELLENSLDAGADRIELDIEKGGHKRIRLKDNGGGIAKDELQLALSRHATSKISTLDDLEQILSLGFRGEALASISSVSRLTLTSRPEIQPQAWQACCEGREMAVKLQPTAHPVGTTIDVADLFYNTPARRKFLRTEKTEFQHIEDVVKRIALSHPNTSFMLKHNGKVVKRYTADKQGALAPRIAAVVGHKFIDNAVHIKVEYDGITMDAWLGNEAMLRSSNDCQFSFVNGRGMRDKLITHAIRQAYESVWGVLEQPSFVVYLNLDPHDVDVNVHPAKHEVRFQQGRLVHDFICKTVADALHSMTNDHEVSAYENGAPPAAEVAFTPPQQSHDYIKPLSSLSPSSSGSAALPSARRQAKGPSAAYQAGFNALMTPIGDSVSATQSMNKLPPACVSLNAGSRMYVNEGKAYCLNGVHIVAFWLIELISKAQNGQPLLMPVAIETPPVSDVTLALFKQHHFEINQVAGKYRLQQVPSGARHLPWLRWFEKLLLSDIETLEDLSTAFIVDCNELDENLCAQIWYWLDEQSDVKQWEYIERFAKVRSVEDLLVFLESKHG